MLNLLSTDTVEFVLDPLQYYVFAGDFQDPCGPIMPTTSGNLNFFLNLNLFCSESAETQLEIEDLGTPNLGLQVVLYHPHPNSRCSVTVQTTVCRGALENSEYGRS